MKQKKQLTAIIEREEDWYVSLCPELDAGKGEVRDWLKSLLD